MNVSHKHRVVWWAPPRTASRALSEVLCHYDFFNATIGEHANLREYPHSHDCVMPAGLEDYDLLLQVRNPYSRMVSCWHIDCFTSPDNEQLVITKDFEKFVLDGVTGFATNYEETLKKEPKYIVRYEQLAEDVKKLPFVNVNDIWTGFERCILNNAYTNEGPHNQTGNLPRNTLNKNYADWQSFYNEKLAEIVYKRFYNQFIKFNYSKDSWIK